jgi:hypothetical protein
MKDALPILTAGGTFMGCALLGLGAGIFVAAKTGNQLWVFGGLFIGLGVGGYSVVRMLLRTP